MLDEAPLDSFLALDATGPGDAPSDDGRLTAREVYDLDLHARLVVLSACRSGLGRPSGDGLFGMARAFFYAGAETTVATLWDVADEPSARLMPRFHELVAAGAERRRRPASRTTGPAAGPPGGPRRRAGPPRASPVPRASFALGGIRPAGTALTPPTPRLVARDADRARAPPFFLQPGVIRDRDEASLATPHASAAAPADVPRIAPRGGPSMERCTSPGCGLGCHVAPRRLV